MFQKEFSINGTNIQTGERLNSKENMNFFLQNIMTAHTS